MSGHDTEQMRAIRLFNGQTLKVDAETADWHDRLVAVCGEIVATRREAHTEWLRLVDAMKKALSVRPLS